jgi:hypothetical protein
LISAQIIKDGAKEYPEIIDYHPEKKVSSILSFQIKIYPNAFPKVYIKLEYLRVLLFRRNLTTLTSKGGVIKTLSFKWTLRLEWANLLVRIRKLSIRLE